MRECSNTLRNLAGRGFQRLRLLTQPYGLDRVSRDPHMQAAGDGFDFR